MPVPKKFPAVIYVHRDMSDSETYLVADEKLIAHADLYNDEHVATYKLVDEMIVRAVVETRRKGKSK